MPRPSIQLVTDSRPKDWSLRAIFREEWQRGEVEIESSWTTSGVLGVAEFTLIVDPDRPVALVLNTGTDDESARESKRGTVHRILSRAAPDGWHVALAVPDLEPWTLAAPAIKAAWDAGLVNGRTRQERAAQIANLATDRPIDQEAIGRAFSDFRDLARFLEASIRALALTA